MSKLEGTGESPAGEQLFDGYMAKQMEKISIDGKDEAFLRERMLTMYANPLRNYNAACGLQ